MPETTAQPAGVPVPASGTVHWIGAGLSTGSGLAALCDAADRVRLWHRTDERAARSLETRGLTGRAEPRAYTLPALTAELAPGDVVVSMLPAPEHAGLLAACVSRGAHFACSSYVSEAVLDQVPAATAAGVVVLTESGLDPGIDHLFAHSLIARAREEIGADTTAEVSLTSYCGGIPAVPNDFRYRFSWAPAGVLNALRSPARYIEAGAETTAPRPWEATRPHVVDGEPFEVYPNRDSLPFVEQYGLPPAWKPQTFIRGTLRLDGWLDGLAAGLRETPPGRRPADHRPRPGVGGPLPDHGRRPRPRGPRRVPGLTRRLGPHLVGPLPAGPGGRRGGERDGAVRVADAGARGAADPRRRLAARPQPGGGDG
ncbi:hypothetical protein QF035_002111 [Streptomyces umbrinus]|uniref:Saccharopine dehydrogenase n=1 Tax=Streptomyces umbrinus TaxID=67370 RepID=A0ABU0SLT9_9ACTN|nr:hypothetical protein [Streptomyces umbrinus]